MAEDTTTVDAPEQDAPTTDAPDETPEQDDEPISKEKAKKLSSEAKNLRERLKAAEDKLKAADDAKLSEQEKLQERVDALTGTIAKRDAATQNLLLLAAIDELRPTMGIRSTKAMAKLIERDSLTFDLDGMSVDGVADELKRLKKEEPELFISGGTDGGAGGSGRAQAVDMNGTLRKALTGGR